jgi:hypothetical protein
LLSGCTSQQDKGRITELEKQSKDLQAQLKVQQATADLELQAKCGKDARAWFNLNWQRDKDTLLLDYSNHYNKSVNKCFILVQYNHSMGAGNYVGKTITLHDVYDNVERATAHLVHALTEDAEQAKAICTIDGDKKDTKSFQTCFNLIYSSFMTK